MPAEAALEHEEVNMNNIVQKSLNNSKWYKYFNKQ
jgi:hypothetical protein